MVKNPESLDEQPPPPKRRGWRRFLWRHLPGLSVTLLTTLFLIVVLWPYVVITVPSDRWVSFGTDCSGLTCTAGALLAEAQSWIPGN